MISIEERFSTALHNTARSWRLALDRRLKDLGVGQAGWMAIANIAKSSRPPSQTELASLLGVEDPSVVAMVDRLVKAGFVLRQPSETDRRVKLLLLTPAGLAIYARVKTEADAFRAELLRGIDAERLRLAIDLLETLQTATDAAP